MPGAPQNVTGPVAVPPNDGLRAARGLGVTENPTDQLDPGNRWVRGYRFVYDACNAGRTADPCDYVAPDLVRGYGGQRWIEPFLVVVGRVCSTFGWEAQDFAADATRLLDAFQYEIIARELWRGDQAIASGWTNPNPDPDDPGAGPGNPFLSWAQDSEYVDLIDANGGAPGSTMTPVEALVALEDGLAACSTSPGLIHVSKRLAVIWSSHGLLEREGGRLFTAIGTQVIADNAYDGSGPTSPPPEPGQPTVPGPPASATREWAYATGPLTVRVETGAPVLNPPAGDLAAALDRAVNDVVYVAQRKASVSWGCCHLGVAVNPLTKRC